MLDAAMQEAQAREAREARREEMAAAQEESKRVLEQQSLAMSRQVQDELARTRVRNERVGNR